MKTNTKLYFAASFVLFLIIIGAFFYHFSEGWSYLDSVYFSTTTITTVGFGDLHPNSVLSKMFTIVYVIIGVGSALYTFTLIAEYYVETHHESFSNSSLRKRIVKRRKQILERKKQLIGKNR